MKVYGLIGKVLSHSFSKDYFESKFRSLKLAGFSYENFELANVGQIKELLNNRADLAGLNVTIPYKESVMPWLDRVDTEARAIGAVNCIKIENGRLTGYNTDVYGFSQSIKPFLDNNHERALLLGAGGASKAVAYALKQLGVECYFVTREKKSGSNFLLYGEVNEHVMRAFKLVVNTTPVGTFPDTDESPLIPYEFFTPEHLAYDLVYNPVKTLFLAKAGERGAITMNGLSMLQLQAEKSWEIWNT